MPSVIVVGGGLAGLSAAAALGEAGFQVDLYEARHFLGGRATSYPVTPSDENSEVIDNCQHVMLRSKWVLFPSGLANRVPNGPIRAVTAPHKHLNAVALETDRLQATDVGDRMFGVSRSAHSPAAASYRIL